MTVSRQTSAPVLLDCSGGPNFIIIFFSERTNKTHHHHHNTEQPLMITQYPCLCRTPGLSLGLLRCCPRWLPVGTLGNTGKPYSPNSKPINVPKTSTGCYYDPRSLAVCTRGNTNTRVHSECAYFTRGNTNTHSTVP